MRNSYKALCLAAAALVTAFVSCQKEKYSPDYGKGSVITVKATVEDVANASKTHINGTQVYWDQDEQMNVVSFNSSSPETSGKEGSSSSFTPSADYTTATFTVTVDNEAANTIVGVYPASAAAGLGSGGDASRYTILLPSSQAATAGSYDPAAYVMITRPQTLPVENNEWTASYIRTAALTRMEVSGLNDDIKSVTITFPEGQAAAGHRYFDLSEGAAGEIQSGQNGITISYAEPLAAGEVQNIWFTSWNVDIAEGETVTVKVESGTSIYTKTFTAKKTVSLKENFLNIMPVNMEGATEEEIAPSDGHIGKYLIVSRKENNTGTWVYMSDISDNNKYFTIGTTDISASIDFESLSINDFEGINGIENHIWTLSRTDDGYTLLNEAQGYYFQADNGGNEAHTSAAPVTVHMAAQPDGTTRIYASSTATRYLQFNANSGAERFACYSSDQQEIYLLPLEESTEPTLTLNEAEKTVSASATSATFNYTAKNLTEDVTASVTADESRIISDVSVDGRNSTINVSLIPNTEEKEKTATITIFANGISAQARIIQKAFGSGEDGSTENQPGWLELPAYLGTEDYINTLSAGNDRNYTYWYDKGWYTSMWVAYPLYAATMGSGRDDNWAANPQIPENEQINVWDGSYGVSVSGTIYSRGHQIPNGDRNGNSTMQRQTFYATNSTPQIQDKFNGGIWNNLENAIQNVASGQDTVYVVTGPTFETVGGSEQVEWIQPKHDSKKAPVPNYYWKAVLKVKRSGESVTDAMAVGFWFEHRQYSDSYENYAVSVDEIERLTGLDLFVNLPDSVESKAESNTSWSSFRNF